MAAQREEITARPKSPRAAERRCAIEATSSDFGLLGDGIRIRRASDHHIMCDEGCQVRRVTVVRFAADYGGTAARSNLTDLSQSLNVIRPGRQGGKLYD